MVKKYIIGYFEASTFLYNEIKMNAYIFYQEKALNQLSYEERLL